MKFKYLYWLGFFLLLGVISVLGQAVLLREITTLFYGNEMLYGLGLGTWLLFTGLGSLLAIKLKFLKDKKVLWWLILGILFIFLPGLVIFLRWLVSKIVPIGALPGFWFTFLVLDSILFIFCFPIGVLFALGASNLGVNRAYFWETIGFATGGLLFSFVLATVSFPLGLTWRYPGLVKAINSKYQQIIISKQDSQQNFFLGGQLAFTNQESFENQQLLSLITPFVEKKEKILIIGNPNIASEIKKILFPEKIVFLEIDKKLGRLEEELLTSGVDLIFGDPRRFLNRKEEWDLIIFSLGNPQTLLANRYFTEECFKQIKNRLSENGIFALLSYLPTDYQSEEAARFGGSIYQTLRSVFPSLELLTPEDQLLFLASKGKLEINPQKIDRKLAAYFHYQIENSKREEIRERLEEFPVAINTDVEPTSFFYQQLFWQTIFSFKAPVYLIKVVKITPVVLLLVLAVLMVVVSEPTRLGLTTASSSFILMSLETLLIFIFQTRIGYLYSQISLIFATALLGLGVGVIISENIKCKILNFKYLFLAYLPLLILVRRAAWWPLTALMVGIVGGMIFALVAQTYLKKAKNSGFIYAFDLFGGFLGAIMTPGLLLPFFGLAGVLKIITAVILINLIPIAKLRG